MVCELRFGMCDRIGITLNRFLRGERLFYEFSTFKRKTQALAQAVEVGRFFPPLKLVDFRA